MATALYDHEVGYYARRVPLGARGDYYTSAELHPGFAALIGRQVEQVWVGLGRPQHFVIHEAGPGSGLFARDLLDWIRDSRPELYAGVEYRLDERSPELRREQARRLVEAGHAERVGWVEGFGGEPFVGLIFANELLDALPVHLVRVRGGRLEELYLDLEGDRLVLSAGQPSTAVLAEYFERLGLRPDEGCRAEVNLAALDWMRAAGGVLAQGMLLVLDYGYPAEALHATSRREGTLLCYYRHTLNSDPLRHVGEQDITSHVDFTSVARAGEAAGLRTVGLVSQRRFLANLDWEELRREVAAAQISQEERGANLRALDALVDAEGLGRILALVQQRGLDDLVPLGLVGGPGAGWERPPLRRREHIRLPDPAEAEGLASFEALWTEVWAGEDDEPTAPLLD